MVCLLWLQGLIAVQANAQQTADCLQIDRQSQALRYDNRCGMPVTLLYCSTGQPIAGKRCGVVGDNNKKKTNLYYTHLRSLSGGDKGELPGKADEVRVAACRGAFNEFNWRGFRAAHDGSVTCPTPYQLSRPAKPDITAQAVGATAAEACEKARATLAPGDVVDRDCECKPLGAPRAANRASGAAVSGAMSCTTQGWLSEADAEAVRKDYSGRLINWVLGQGRCAMFGLGHDCLYRAEPMESPHGRGTSTGVRD